MSKSFTLIEILVVLSLIAILAAILIVVINPSKIFQNARDSQRTEDLNRIGKLINLMMVNDPTFYELKYASSNIVYISLQDSSPTCANWLSQLPSLSSNWSYQCSATPTNIDGYRLVAYSFFSKSSN